MAEQDIIEKVQNIITNDNIILNKHVPYKVLQLNYLEKQSFYGLYRSFSIYCVSNNNMIKVEAKIKNDFFETSELKLYSRKTTIKNKVQHLEMNYDLYDGKSEETLFMFNALKKKFYEPYVNLKVLPKQ
jgi:hypothetical protein